VGGTKHETGREGKENATNGKIGVVEWWSIGMMGCWVDGKWNQG
jgi:hypothetical protein